MAQQTKSEEGRLAAEVRRSDTIRNTHKHMHIYTHTKPVGLLWTSGRPVADAATRTT